MYLVDTNIFLKVMLSKLRKASCKLFLNALKTGEKRGVVTDFSMHSIMVVNSDKYTSRDIKRWTKKSK